jgi:hypothetical protein
MNYETTSPQLNFASTHEHTTPILTSKVFDLFQYEKVLQNSTIGFLLLLQLANKRKKLFIYRRGAHGLLKEGAPSGGMWAAKWGEWAATSLIPTNKCQNTPRQRGGRHLFA